MDKQAIYGIVFDKDRKQVLLVERRDLPVWVLPGGGLDPGESPEEGVIREVEEETGFKVRIKKQIAEYLPVNRLTQKTYFFECEIIGGSAKTNSEAKQISFFSITALPTRLPPPFPGWITDALSSKKEKIVKKTEGVTYLTLVKLLIQHPILILRYLLTKIGIRFNNNN